MSLGFLAVRREVRPNIPAPTFHQPDILSNIPTRPENRPGSFLFFHPFGFFRVVLGLAGGAGSVKKLPAFAFADLAFALAQVGLARITLVPPFGLR